MGKEGKYDLQLAGPLPIPDSSDEDDEETRQGIYFKQGIHMLISTTV